MINARSTIIVHSFNNDSSNKTSITHARAYEGMVCLRQNLISNTQYGMRCRENKTIFYYVQF